MRRPSSMWIKCAVFAGLCSGMASATPLTWNIVGGTFDDGGVFSGSFIWDAVTNTMSSWSIAVSGGNTGSFPAFTFDNTTSSFSLQNLGNPVDSFLFKENSSSRQFRITPVSPLTDAGGTISLDLATAFGGSGGVECFNCSPFRLITAGALDSAIPEPTTVGLTGIALAGLVALGRRRVAPRNRAA